MTSRNRILAFLLAGLGLTAHGLATAQETGITKDTIKIGVMGPLTGPAAVFGKGVFGAEAVFKEANDKGGIHGRRIEIVRDDDGCDPARGLAAFKKQASQVFAIDGASCTNVMMAIKGEVEKAKIPFMVLGAASPAVSNPISPNIFQPIATTIDVGHTMIDYIMSKPGTTKVAFVSHSDDWGKANRDPAVGWLKEKYKLDPVLDLTMERGSTDATPQVLKLRSSGAQFIVLMMYPAEVAIFMRDLYKYGVKTPTLAPQSISLEDTRDRVGNPAAVQNFGVFYAYAHPLASPEMQKVAAMINKYYPEERVENFSFLSMTGAYALVRGLQDAGPEPTREKLVAALNNLKNFDPGIASSPLTFSAQDHAGIKGGAIATFRGGKVVVVKSWQEQ